MGELAALTEGHIGKSGLNHRLKKLEQIAEKIGKEAREYDEAIIGDSVGPYCCLCRLRIGGP